MKSILGIFSKISKGNIGETEVLESITKLLKNGKDETNFFIIPKVQIEDGSTTKEIDIILLHPLFGLFVIEVKNWNKLIVTEENNPFEQAKEYKNLLLAKIKDEFGKVAINVEFRVVFPQLTYEDAKEFLAELGLDQSGLDKLIKASFKLLGLITFLTAGVQEVRAWTITDGTKAPEAGGKIHSDIERGFIRAEIVSYDDLIAAGSQNAAKEKGQVRLEGKEYIMKDGDVTYFRFNV